MEIRTFFSLLQTYYYLFFIKLSTRQVHLAGITEHPHQAWMCQIARNLTMEDHGFLKPNSKLILDRDAKFCPAFHNISKDSHVEPKKMSWRSPNLNAFARRWVRSVKDECLRRMTLIGEPMLRGALKQYVKYYNEERPHQGLDNSIPFPCAEMKYPPDYGGRIVRRSKLGGMLNSYYREAA